MPPKKRARVSQAASPAATDQHKTPTPAAQSPSKPDEDILNDPWTDEEAIGLFKAVVKWKPTGIHKHFRMLQIRQYLLDNRYIHPKAPHTSISGLWAKLATLYDLESLDEREDARQLSDVADSRASSDSDDSAPEDDVYSLAGNKIHSAPFALPDDDAFVAEEAWRRRLPGAKERRDGSESPAVLPEVNMDREPPLGYVRGLRARAESEEPAVTPEVEEQVKRPRGRPKGSTNVKAGAQAAKEAPAGNRRRSARQAPEQEEEDEGSESESEEEEGEDEEDEEEEESSEEEEEGSEDNTPAPRSGRGGSGRGRGRPARGGRGRKKK